MLARHHQNFSMFSFGNPNRKPGTCHDGILPRRLAPNGRAPCKSLKLTQAPRAPLHPKVNRTPLLGWWTEISRRSSFFSSPLFLSTPCFPSPPKKKCIWKAFFLSEPKIPRIPKENHGGCFFSGCGENIFTLTNHESLATLMEKRRVRLDPPCGDTNGTDGAKNDKIPHSRPGRSSSDWLVYLCIYIYIYMIMDITISSLLFEYIFMYRDLFEAKNNRTNSNCEMSRLGSTNMTPKWSFLVGKPMVVGYHHFWKPTISPRDQAKPWLPLAPLTKSLPFTRVN